MIIPIDDGILRIISIDPGTNSAGFSVMGLNVETGEITVEFSRTFLGRDLLKTRKEFSKNHTEKDARLDGYYKRLSSLLKFNCPEAIVCETPYMGRFAATFGALKEQLMLFRLSAWDYDRSLPLNFIEPSPVKVHMGVSGKSGDKDQMHDALKKRTDVSYGDDVVLLNLDEHEVDSICIGLWYLDQLKKVIHG